MTTKWQRLNKAIKKMSKKFYVWPSRAARRDKLWTMEACLAACGLHAWNTFKAKEKPRHFLCLNVCFAIIHRSSLILFIWGRVCSDSLKLEIYGKKWVNKNVFSPPLRFSRIQKLNEILLLRRWNETEIKINYNGKEEEEKTRRIKELITIIFAIQFLGRQQKAQMK